ncbi:MAG TPA: nucleotidyltransferase family protein [Fimbriimonadaceae bacterium]|nr:nucleotidyltransferase family protein [Fimbriimonadaceae bacterium]
MPGFAVIVLAAGGSSRLGRPKQLVEFQGEALLRRAARTAVESGADQVIVVLGAGSIRVAQALQGLNVETVENLGWREGLSSSVRAGITAVRPSVDVALLTLCDMPMVTPELLGELAASVAEELPVATCEYAGHDGPPAAFHRSRWDALCGVDGDRGARSVVEAADRIARLPFPGGEWDVDSPEDVARLTELEATS